MYNRKRIDLIHRLLSQASRLLKEYKLSEGVGKALISFNSIANDPKTIFLSSCCLLHTQYYSQPNKFPVDGLMLTKSNWTAVTLLPTTTKPYPTKWSWLHGSNYAIMFYHKQYLVQLINLQVFPNSFSYRVMLLPPPPHILSLYRYLST